MEQALVERGSYYGLMIDLTRKAASPFDCRQSIVVAEAIMHRPDPNPESQEAYPSRRRRSTDPVVPESQIPNIGPSRKRSKYF